jgi:IclR family pca regulon transcriptional regulator
MGRVLLAGLPEAELDAYLQATSLERHTERTVVDPARLRAVLEGVRADGWALVDQELELGLRSIAAPLRDAGGATFAALNLSAAASRVSTEDLLGRLLPPLLEAAGEISTAVARSAPRGLDNPARGF